MDGEAVPGPGPADVPEPGLPVGMGPIDRSRANPNTVLLSLFVSLLGFVGIALLLYEFKFHDVTATFHGMPTRILFVVFVALAASPFYATLFGRVPVIFLISPVLVIVFLYPLFSPYGIPYSHDPVFNYQFSQALLTTGTWEPLHGVTLQAEVYSYYPGGAVFNAEVATLTTLPELATFNWSYDLLRLLVIPLAIYALAGRVFGGRGAPLAVLFYLSIPSVEMNVPTQQDFATIWFILVMVCLAFLATSKSEETTFLRVMVVVASVMVVISHHVSTYLLLGFLIGLVVLPRLLRRHDPYPNARTLSVLTRTVVVVLAWTALVTFPVVRLQQTFLFSNTGSLLHHAGTTVLSTNRGQSFPLYMTGWIILAIAVLVLLGFLTLIETYRTESLAFVSFGLLTAILVTVFAVPFVSTGFSFLAVRILEYGGVFLAPATAWWLANRLGRAMPPQLPEPRHPPPVRAPRGRARIAWVGVALAVIVAFLVVGGGSLVPLSTRDQFAAAPSAIQISSGRLVNDSAYAAATWANAHLDHSGEMWGDYLTYLVMGGFGGFQLAWDSYPAFANATFNTTLLHRMHPGQYVVLDAHMTTPYSAPMFYGPATDQPNGPIPAANLVKYDQPQYFLLVYTNAVFQIYEILSLPPPGS